MQHDRPLGLGGSESRDGYAGTLAAAAAKRGSGRAARDKSGPRGGGGIFAIENGEQVALVQPIMPAEQTVVTGKNATDNEG